MILVAGIGGFFYNCCEQLNINKNLGGTLSVIQKGNHRNKGEIKKPQKNSPESKN